MKGSPNGLAPKRKKPRRFRRLIASLSAAFPPKFVAERVLPWATLLLAAVGGVWAIQEYRNDLAIARVTTTIELHKRYTEKFFAAKNEFAQAIRPFVLRARCEFIQIAVTDGKLEPPQNPLNCENIDQGTLETLKLYNLEGDLRTQSRNYILSEVGRSPLSRENAQSLAQVSIIFRSIIVCVEQSNCDPETSVALFAREMVEFVNMTCAFEAQASLGGKTVNEEIARFLVDHEVHRNIYWSLDPQREKLFACEALRALEK